MSTIRQHGVAFHLLSMPDDGLWLEVIRESDGAVLASEPFTGGSDDLGPAVDEWFGDIIGSVVDAIDVATCRLCDNRRRAIREDEHDRVLPDYLVEWEYDLCLTCASRLEHTSPWIRTYIAQRYFIGPDDDL